VWRLGEVVNGGRVTTFKRGPMGGNCARAQPDQVDHYFEMEKGKKGHEVCAEVCRGPKERKAMPSISIERQGGGKEDLCVKKYRAVKFSQGPDQDFNQ